MKALLTALKEGRLIELPETDKQKALTLLGSLIEAIPGIHANARIVEEILAREAQANTYLGYGIACPHAGTAFIERAGYVVGSTQWRYSKSIRTRRLF